MSKLLKLFLTVFSIFFIIIFCVTFGLTIDGYFEQDEWMGIADVMNSYNHPWWRYYLPWVHFNPLASFVWSSLYRIFPLQAQYYFLLELLIHSACASLVVILSFRLTKNKAAAILTGFLFLLNSRAHQAFTHLAIFHTTTAAMFFILLFVVYLSGIKDKVFTWKNTLILYLIFLAAIGFREEGYMIIPLFAAYIVAFDRSKINKENIKHHAFLAVGVIATLVVRFVGQKINTTPIPAGFEVSGIGAEYNFATIPIKFIVQNLIYAERIALFFVANTENLYPAVESFWTSHAPIMDSGLLYVFGILVCIFSVWIWHIKPKGLGPIMLFMSVWILANAFMLSFVGRHISVVEPRYLYFSSFPVLCILSIVLHSAFVHRSNLMLLDLAKKIAVVIALLFLLLTSLPEIRVAVKRQVDDGIAKKRLLSNLIKVHPKLSDNTIFYVKCKTGCSRNIEDFGIPNDNVMPFSSGPGMIFLIKYANVQNEEKKWGPFLTQDFLFHTFSQGYRKIGRLSYGYFTDKEKLEKTIAKKKISKDIVVALEYDENNYSFRDISTTFRSSLK